MAPRKKVLGWVKSALAALFALGVMGGSIFLVPRDQWIALARYVPVFEATARSSENRSPTVTGSQKEQPTHAPVQLNVTQQQLIGITTTEVVRLPLTHTIRTMGKVDYDETKLTDINLRMDGSRGTAPSMNPW